MFQFPYSFSDWIEEKGGREREFHFSFPNSWPSIINTYRSNTCSEELCGVDLEEEKFTQSLKPCRGRNGSRDNHYTIFVYALSLLHSLAPSPQPKDGVGKCRDRERVSGETYLAHHFIRHSLRYSFLQIFMNIRREGHGNNELAIRIYWNRTSQNWSLIPRIYKFKVWNTDLAFK